MPEPDAIDRYCTSCGRLLSPTGRVGRPRTTCDEDCYKVAKHLRNLEALMQRVAPRLATTEQGLRTASDLRSKLWSCANRLNVAGRPVARPPADA